MAGGDAGGSAAAGGSSYQARCGAWFSTLLLTGSTVGVGGLWSGQLVRLDCETGEGVDDLRVTPDKGPLVYVQCKRSITLQTAGSSELAKTVRQFVTHHRSTGHDDDRLALVTSNSASGQVRVALRAVLNRLRDADGNAPIATSAKNQNESKALNTVVAHVIREWETAAGQSPTETQLRTLLRHCFVEVLDVEPGGAHEHSARTALEHVITTGAAASWPALIEACARLAAERSGTGREGLQRRLVEHGIKLRTTDDFSEDVQRLIDVSARELSALGHGLITIPTPSGELTIERSSVDQLLDAGRSGPLLVVGDPGAGKTVALHRLARELADSGTPTLFLPVGSFSSTSLGDLRNELGLDHEVEAVLAAWAPGSDKVFVVDALDAARGDGRTGLWNGLVRSVSRLEGWHVVASIRTWDLQHSVQLRDVVAGVSHTLGDLTDDELASVSASWPDLATLLGSATPGLHALLHNPFNLRLAADLLCAGADLDELSRLTDHLTLLDRYWSERVVSGVGGSARNAVAMSAARLARDAHAMTVPTAELTSGDASAAEPINELLSRSVLVDATAVRTPMAADVRFAHHILFDYAVSMTFVSPPDALVTAISADPNMVIFARPSIGMYLERLWRDNLDEFWRLTVQLYREGAGARLVAVAATGVAARSASKLEDLAPLLGLSLGDDPTGEHRGVLRFLAIGVDLEHRANPAAVPGVWPAACERLSARAAEVDVALRIVMSMLVDVHGPLQGDDLDQCGVAARRWLDALWTLNPAAPVRFALEAVVATAAADPAESETLLRRCLEPAQLASLGAGELYSLCDAVEALEATMPRFVEDLYVAVLGYDEESTDPTVLFPSRIMGLTSNRRQDVEMAKYALVENFGHVMDTSLLSAAEVLTRVFLDD